MKNFYITVGRSQAKNLTNTLLRSGLNRQVDHIVYNTVPGTMRPQVEGLGIDLIWWAQPS